MDTLYAGMEIGGTFAKAAIFKYENSQFELVNKIQVDTTEPDATFSQLADFLSHY